MALAFVDAAWTSVGWTAAVPAGVDEKQVLPLPCSFWQVRISPEPDPTENMSCSVASGSCGLWQGFVNVLLKTLGCFPCRPFCGVFQHLL